MGAPRVTPQEVVEMHRLYRQLGKYSAVGQAMKPSRSGSTVAKYIKMENVPSAMRIAVENLMNQQGIQ